MGKIMRKKLIILIALFCMFLAIGCVENNLVTPEKAVTQNDTDTPTGEEATERQNATEIQDVTEKTEIKEYTLEELAKYNGKNKTIYVAYQGKVYDVSSDSYLWKDGNHEGCTAGKDITEELDKTPHRAEILKKYPVVGILKK
jgi:Predicted heme/steroid binding protein